MGAPRSAYYPVGENPMWGKPNQHARTEPYTWWGRGREVPPKSWMREIGGGYEFYST